MASAEIVLASLVFAPLGATVVGLFLEERVADPELI
jgi:hypothetical protein